MPASGGTTTDDARRSGPRGRGQGAEAGQRDLVAASSFFARDSTRDFRGDRVHRRAPRPFGVEPICSVLTEHGVKIAPPAYYYAAIGAHRRIGPSATPRCSD